MSNIRQFSLNLYTWLIVVFLLLPVAIVIPAAVSAGSSLVFPPEGLSMKWFLNMWNTQGFVAAAWTSLWVATISTGISLFLGTLASIAFVRYDFRVKKWLEGVSLMPLVLPAIVLAVALVIVLGRLGLLSGLWGLIFAHSIITFPYIVKTVTAAYVNVDRNLEEAAATLGASPYFSFRRVTLPLLAPGLIAGAVFSFLISFDEFTVSLFLVNPRTMTLPLQIFFYTEFSLDPTIAAVSTCIVFFTVAVILVMEKAVSLTNHMR